MRDGDVPIVIAAAEPVDTSLAMAAGDTKQFAVQLPAGRQTDDIVWSLAGEPIASARGKTTWQYTADAEAGGRSYDLTVAVDGGRAAGQRQTWTITVERPQVAIVEPVPAAEEPAVAPRRPARSSAAQARAALPRTVPLV